MTTNEFGFVYIQKGVCTSETETLLKSRTECGFLFRQQRYFITNTILYLLRGMCSKESVDDLINNIVINPETRLVPLETVFEYQDATISSDIKSGK